jgi:hypothetical protein
MASQLTTTRPRQKQTGFSTSEKKRDYGKAYNCFALPSFGFSAFTFISHRRLGSRNTRKEQTSIGEMTTSKISAGFNSSSPQKKMGS